MAAGWRWLTGVVLVGLVVSGGAAPTSAQDDASGAACAVAEAALCRPAAALDRALRSADIDALLGLMHFADYACPAPAGAPATVLCSDDGTGSVRAGFLVGYLQAEAAVFSPSQLRGVLGDWLRAADPNAGDSHGDGSPRLVTIGCTAAHQRSPAGCRGEAVLVASAIIRQENGSAVRQQILFRAVVSPEGDNARVVDAVVAVLEGDDLEAAMQGGPGTIFTTDAATDGVYLAWAAP